MKKLTLAEPIKFRRNIPFYHDKIESEFKNDKYENYAEVVTRQTRLHLGADAWKKYVFQPVLDWIFQEIKETSPVGIADIGCGVGRLIGELATRFPAAECFGIDYSYQLLRQAYDYWVEGKTLELPISNRGFLSEKIAGQPLPNIHFALAKGEALPFENNSLDLIFSSFALDRFEHPKTALEAMFRVLKKDGKLLIVSPLSFEKSGHWEKLFPIDKLQKEVEEIGFIVAKVETNLVIKEPLDIQGNEIHWKCVGIVLKKEFHHKISRPT